MLAYSKHGENYSALSMWMHATCFLSLDFGTVLIMAILVSVT